MNKVLKPLGDRAILKRRDNTMQGRVITGDLGRDDVGQECEVIVAPIPTELLRLQKGDVVYIPKAVKYGMSEIEFDGQKYVVIDANLILARVDDEEENV